MASNLYEILGLERTAPAEEIKRAYRKRALKTHPDRLPPNATEEEKKNAEEQFRLVNNAYEVLTDEDKRKVYDEYGVWPPPEQMPHHPDARPFFNHGHHHSRHPHHHHRHQHHSHRRHYMPPFFDHTPFFGFTDPHTLFDSIFRDVFPAMHHGQSGQGPRFHSWGDDDPIFHSHSPFASHFPVMPMMPSVHRSMPPFGLSLMDDPFFGDHFGSSFQTSSSQSRDGNTRWVSDSRTTQIVNGAKSSIWKRTDSTGNQHVTRTYPDGREVYTINGVEQNPGGGFLPPSQAPPPPMIEPSRSANYAPQAANPAFPPPPYSKRRENQTEPPFIPPEYERHRNGFIPDHIGHQADQDRSQRKTWWHKKH